MDPNTGEIPVSDDTPWGAAFPDPESIAEGWRYGWESGYYECYARCVGGPLGLNIALHIITELQRENIAQLISKIYYSFTDKRFTNFGNSSKKMIPRATKTVSKWLGRGLAAWFAIEAWDCIRKCKECL